MERLLAASNTTPESIAIPPALEPKGAGETKHRRNFATFRVVLALMLREMSTRYGRSPGGYIWAVLEPIGFIAVLAIAFSFMLRNPSLGNSFILFYASGFLPFNVYQALQGTVGSAIKFSRPLLLYPAVTWLDAIIARFILNLMTGALVTLIVLGGIIAVSETTAVLDVTAMIGAVLLAAFLGLGIGTVNCLLGGLFPLWDTIWGIASRPLFLISGVFFIYEDLPQVVQDILWFNPLLHITGLMRTGLYPTYDATYVSVWYVLGIALVEFAVGLFFLRAYHKDVINRN